MARLSMVVAVAALLGSMAYAEQPGAETRLVGREFSAVLDMKSGQNITIDTVTLKFGADPSAATFTVDFIAQHGLPSGPAPVVVDVVMTQHPAGEESPLVTLRVNDEVVPVVARQRHARSIVTSISFTEFQRLTQASSVVERAFDTDLVFGDGQLRMLRSTAERWATGR